MVLLYEGSSILFGSILFILSCIAIIGLILLIVGMVYGYSKKDYKNSLTQAGIGMILAPILFFVLAFACTYLITLIFGA